MRAPKRSQDRRNYYSTENPLPTTKIIDDPEYTYDYGDYFTITERAQFNHYTDSEDYNLIGLEEDKKTTKPIEIITTNSVGTQRSPPTRSSTHKTTPFISYLDTGRRSTTIAPLATTTNTPRPKTTSKPSTQIIPTTTPITTTKTISLHESQTQSDPEIIINIGNTRNHFNINHNNNLHNKISNSQNALATNSNANRSSLLTITANVDFSNRSKQHANKTHKNQQQKSPQQQSKQAKQQTSPTKPTTPPVTNKSHAPSTIETTTTPGALPLNSAIPQTNNKIQQTLVQDSSNVQIQKSIEVSASRLQSLEDVETISDESQNVQITQQRHEYQPSTTGTTETVRTIYSATSPRGNLLRSNSEKSYRSKQTEELVEKHSDEYQKPHDKRKRLQNFVLSDVEPQSFKPAPSIKASLLATKDEQKTSEEFVNSASSSSTTLRYPTLPEPQPFQYSLQTGTNGFSLRAENPSLDAVDDTSLPLYERRPKTQIFTTTLATTSSSTTTTSTTPAPTTTTTTTTTTRRPTFAPITISSLETFHSEELLPTTYAPPLRNWRTGRPTPQVHVEFSSDETTPSSTSTKSILSSTSIKSITSTERPLQSFTARATVFKDSLSKTTVSPAHRFVSPYKSLETILQEKDERFGRTTTKPRYTIPASTPMPFLQTTSKPTRSYFLITTPAKNLSETIATLANNPRNYSISDAILNNFSTVSSKVLPITTPTTTTTSIESQEHNTSSTEAMRPRGRSRYTLALETDAPTTYAPKFRFPNSAAESSTPSTFKPYRRKVQRARIATVQGQQGRNFGISEKYQNYKSEQQQQRAAQSKSQNRKPIENESTIAEEPRAEALVAYPIETKQDNSIEDSRAQTGLGSSSSTELIVAITDRPLKYFYSNKYRQQTAEQTLAEGLQNAGYLSSSTGRSKFRPKSVLEQLQLFLAGESEENDSPQQFADDFTQPEIKAAVKEIKNLYTSTSTTSTLRPTTIATPPTSSLPSSTTSTTTHYIASTHTTLGSRLSSTTSGDISSSTSSPYPSSTSTTTTAKPALLIPMRASRVNNAIKSSIAAAAASSSSQATSATSVGRSHKVNNGLSVSSSLASNSNVAAAVKCSDSTSNAKCNEIPSRYLQYVLTKTKNTTSSISYQNFLTGLSRPY